MYLIMLNADHVYNKHYRQLINKKQAITIIVYTSADPLSTPQLIIGIVTNSAVVYRVQQGFANALITGYEVTPFGVPMIGEYM